MSLEAGQLLLLQDTAVACLKGANQFSIDQEFAKKVVEQLSEASTRAIKALREAERAEVEKGGATFPFTAFGPRR
jgi:hypothetical protein